MKALTLAAALSLLAAPALAETSSTSNSGSSMSGNQSSSMSSSQNQASNQNQAATAQKIKTDLEKAGFKDVKVVAQSFAVTAKSHDGSPVYMTFGPSSMSIIEPVGTVPNQKSGSQSNSNHSSSQSK